MRKKNDFNIYYKLFYDIKMRKKAFLIRYAKTRYIKKDKLFDSFNFSSSVIYLLKDIDEGGKLKKFIIKKKRPFLSHTLFIVSDL